MRYKEYILLLARAFSKPVLFLFFFFVPACLFAQVTFHKIIGTDSIEFVTDMNLCDDKGFIVTGSSAITPGTIQYHDDLFLTKTDSAGNVLWTKTYGNPAHYDFPSSVSQTMDKGYIIGGGANTYGAGPENGFLIKTDAYGNLQWSKSYNFAHIRIPPIVRQTPDSGFVFIGLTLVWGGVYKTYLARTDASGNLLWARVYDSDPITNGRDWSGDLQLTSDGGYAICGSNETGGLGTNKYLMYLFKTDGNGNLQWAKSYGNANYSATASSMRHTNDGGYILTGEISNTSFGISSNMNIYVVKTDSLGNMLWNRIYGSTGGERGLSIEQGIDGNYMIGALTSSFGNSGEFYVLKINSNGSLIRSKTYGTVLNELPVCGVITPDRGYAMVGNTTGASTDIYFMRADSLGNTNGCNQLTPLSLTDSLGSVTVLSATQISTSGYVNKLFALDSPCFKLITQHCASGIPLYHLGNDTIICQGDSVLLDAGTHPGATYLWHNGATSQTIKVGSPGKYYIDILYPCYTATDTLTITVLQPSAAISGSDSVCLGSSLTLTASGGTSYVWNTANSNAIVTVTPTINSLYTVTASIGSCSDTASFNVIIKPLPIASINGDTLICQADSAILAAQGGTSYTWNTGATTQTINTGTVLISTPYSVTVSLNTCTAVATVNLSVNKPIAYAGPDITINEGESIALNASGGNSYSWFPASGLSCTNCENPLVSPLQTTTYCVQVTDTMNCMDTTCVTVFVEELCNSLFVPNAFSPNGDGENDIFYVKGNCIKDFWLVIYDRWGEKVFESKDPLRGWDGKYKNQEKNSTVFVYKLTATKLDGEEVNQKGNISLIR